MLFFQLTALSIYPISSPEQFEFAPASVEFRCFLLSDIEFTAPLEKQPKFKYLNGYGHKIKNLTILGSQNAYFMSMFSSAIVENLVFENATVVSNVEGERIALFTSVIQNSKVFNISILQALISVERTMKYQVAGFATEIVNSDILNVQLDVRYEISQRQACQYAEGIVAGFSNVISNATIEQLSLTLDYESNADITQNLSLLSSLAENAELLYLQLTVNADLLDFAKAFTIAYCEQSNCYFTEFSLILSANMPNALFDVCHGCELRRAVLLTIEGVPVTFQNNVLLYASYQNFSSSDQNYINRTQIALEDTYLTFDFSYIWIIISELPQIQIRRASCSNGKTLENGECYCHDIENLYTAIGTQYCLTCTQQINSLPCNGFQCVTSANADRTVGRCQCSTSECSRTCQLPYFTADCSVEQVCTTCKTEIGICYTIMDTEECENPFSCKPGWDPSTFCTSCLSAQNYTLSDDNCVRNVSECNDCHCANPADCLFVNDEEKCLLNAACQTGYTGSCCRGCAAGFGLVNERCSIIECSCNACDSSIKCHTVNENDCFMINDELECSETTVCVNGFSGSYCEVCDKKVFLIESQEYCYQPCDDCHGTDCYVLDSVEKCLGGCLDGYKDDNCKTCIDNSVLINDNCFYNRTICKNCFVAAGACYLENNNAIACEQDTVCQGGYDIAAYCESCLTGYEQHGQSCIEQSAPCLSCNTDPEGACIITLEGVIVCDAGYGCQPNYNISTNCQQCDDFYEIVNGMCHMEGYCTDCRTAPENECYLSLDGKITCVDGYTCEQGYKHPYCQECDAFNGYAGQGCQTIKQVCQECKITDSQSCWQQNGLLYCASTTTCNANYASVISGCQECAAGYFMHEGSCQPQIACTDCLVLEGFCWTVSGEFFCSASTVCAPNYDIASHCRECLPGHRLFDGHCLEICADCYSVDACLLNGGGIVCLGECQAGFSGEGCRSCAIGYELSNSACAPKKVNQSVHTHPLGTCIYVSGALICDGELECAGLFTQPDCVDCTSGYKLWQEQCVKDGLYGANLGLLVVAVILGVVLLSELIFFAVILIRHKHRSTTGTPPKRRMKLGTKKAGVAPGSKSQLSDARKAAGIKAEV